jgi:monooxygenase
VRRLLPARAAATVNRWRSIARGSLVYALSRRRPDAMRRVLRRAARKRLPEGYDVDRHFSPAYNPWDERLCATPDGDFFAAIASGHAEIVTDTIAHFTTDGIALTSGRELAADVIVSATGLQLLVFGGIEIVVDGHVIEPRDTVSYRGMMLSGVPNLAFAIGYTNASWTLKIELVMAHVAQILESMEKSGSPVVIPVSQEDPAKLDPLIDLSSGYIRRGAHLLPRQSHSASWRAHQSYTADRALFRSGLGDGVVFPRTREHAS